MFKRLFWLGAGAGLTLWAQRRFKREIEKYQPERVAQQVSGTVRGIGSDLRASALAGREAMREREESLRGQFRPPAR